MLNASNWTENGRDFWSMSRLEKSDLDASEAFETWNALQRTAYNAKASVEEFNEVLTAAKSEGTIDAIDANYRSALILLVQVAANISITDEVLGSLQVDKIKLLLDAGANIWLWDEDHETALSIAHQHRRHDLAILLLDAEVSRHGPRDRRLTPRDGITFQSVVYMPLVSSKMLQAALFDAPFALSQTVKAVVGAYTSLSVEGVAATVCASFLVSPQRRWWRESIFNTVSWAISARMRERQLRVTDQFQSDNCADLAAKLELSCAAVLQELARGGMNTDLYTKCGNLLLGGAGERAFELAVSGKCKLFLSQSAVLRYMTRSWRGYAIDCLVESLSSADEHTFIPLLANRGVPRPLILLFL